MIRKREYFVGALAEPLAVGLACSSPDADTGELRAVRPLLLLTAKRGLCAHSDQRLPTRYGCCAPGCNANNDSDCSPSCGDGVMVTGETCDPPSSYPGSCDVGGPNYPDSGVLYYWNPQTLAPVASRRIVSSCGLGVLAGSSTLALSGLARLRLTDDAWAPNPFTVTAYLKNAGSVSEGGEMLTLSFGESGGLALEAGETATPACPAFLLARRSAPPGV